MTDDDQQRHVNDTASAGPGTDDAAGAATPPEEGPASRRGSSFDPTPHLRQLRGRGGNGEYLDVKWSLVWLRREHPDAQIVTEHVQIDSTLAIFKATVSLPTGGIATGYGSETTADFRDYIEKAETKAIGRALRALGFGAPNNEGEDEVETVTPAAEPASPMASSQRQPAATGTPRPRPAPVERPAPAAGAETTQRTPSARPAPAASPRPRPIPAEQPAAAGPAASAGEDPDLADYSWTAFWPWARGIGLPDKKAIEDLVGRSTDGVMPAELRGLILAARGEG
ncbi:MAG: hypothetical protein M3464_18190 [Chloroflexota bacterium]|nr:hypothetical protein [Chloroflexota bacterium]